MLEIDQDNLREAVPRPMSISSDFLFVFELGASTGRRTETAGRTDGRTDGQDP